MEYESEATQVTMDESMTSPFVGRWELHGREEYVASVEGEATNPLFEVGEGGLVTYENGRLSEILATERGYELGGFLAVMSESTNQCIVWVREKEDGVDDRVEWRRPKMDVVAEAEEAPIEETSAVPPPTAKEILLEAGESIGKSAEQMKNIILHIVEEEWHETQESLQNLTEDDWRSLKVPGALVKAITQRLTTQASSAQEPLAKRPRISESLIHEGDMLEGFLHLSAKKAPPIRFAVYISAIGCDPCQTSATLSMRVGYETCIAGKQSLVLFEATGSYNLSTRKVDMRPTALIEPLGDDSVRTFQFQGRFDTRFRKATLGGEDCKMLKADFTPINSLKFDSFEAGVKSTAKTRNTIPLSPSEQSVMGKLDETAADRKTADSLVQALQQHLGKWSSDSLPVCDKWRRQLDDIAVSTLCAPKTLIRGPTGSGKSYLLNAVIGIPDFCPSDCSTGRAVTATTIAVTHRAWSPSRADGVSEWLLHSVESQNFTPLRIEDLKAQTEPVKESHKRYGANIQLYSKQEWQQEKCLHVKTLAVYWLEDRQESKLKKQRPNETDTGGHEAWDKLAAVYGRELASGRTKTWEDEEALLDHLKALDAKNYVVQSLSREKTLEDNSLESYKRRMKVYQRTDAQGSAPQFWPVVKRIAQFAPIERTRGLGELVDSVGHGDSNAARNAIAQSDENSANTVLVAVDIGRCASNQIGIDILQNQLRYSLMKCDQNDLAFICTKADVMNTREVTQTLKLRETATFQECVRARNSHVKATMQKEIQQMIADMQFGEQEKDVSWFKCNVFTVSTKSYMAQLGLESAENAGELLEHDTEVPAVVRLLQVQALKWHNRAAGQQVLALGQLTQAMRSQLGAGESPEEQKKQCRAVFDSLFSNFKASLESEMTDFWENRMHPAIAEDIQASIESGRQRATRGAPQKAETWKQYHPCTYRAAVMKEGIHPASRKGNIHWPNELSAICYDSFQPQWMQLFGSLLPELLTDLTFTVLKAVDGFHDQLAEKFPASAKLAGLREGIKIDLWLARQRAIVDITQRAAQKDLSEEVVNAVRREMKKDFTAAKDPSLCKGKGCVQRLKDHMDKSLAHINWDMTTRGLMEGLNDMKISLDECIENIVETVPQLIEDGYKVLWQDLDEAAWKQWREMCGGLLPIVEDLASSVNQLLARLQEREDMVRLAAPGAQRASSSSDGKGLEAPGEASRKIATPQNDIREVN